MNKEVSISDIIDIMVEKLEEGGTVTFTPKGKSMLPMLRDGEDVVVLAKREGRLRLFDVPFYRRKDGTYVLHRIVGFDPDGSYILCGDNQFVLEHGISDEDIIAVMTGFYRNGKPYTRDSFLYRLYVNMWYYTRYFRRAYSFAKRHTTGRSNRE